MDERTAVIYHRPFGPHCVLKCPRGRGTCSAEVKPSIGAQWENVGSDEKPTLSPSFNCVGGCGWHGYIVDGRLVDAPTGVISSIVTCAGCKHPHLITIGPRGFDAEGRAKVALGFGSLRDQEKTDA